MYKKYNIYINKLADFESEKALKQIENKEEIINIDRDNYLGIITIALFELKLPVKSDWSYELMKTSPNRYYGSIETNDLVICAHQY